MQCASSRTVTLRQADTNELQPRSSSPLLPPTLDSGDRLPVNDIRSTSSTSSASSSTAFSSTSSSSTNTTIDLRASLNGLPTQPIGPLLLVTQEGTSFVRGTVQCQPRYDPPRQGQRAHISGRPTQDGGDESSSPLMDALPSASDSRLLLPVLMKSLPPLSREHAAASMQYEVRHFARLSRLYRLPIVLAV